MVEIMVEIRDVHFWFRVIVDDAIIDLIEGKKNKEKEEKEKKKDGTKIGRKSFEACHWSETFYFGG